MGKMMASLVLTTLFVAALHCTCLSAPKNKLFDPFGDFLQGNRLYTKTNSKINKFYSTEDLTESYKVFASTLEDSKELDKLFNDFKLKFKKTYSSASEEQKRKEIFKQNLLKVFAHNANATDGKSSFTQHISQFADMTTDEIIKRITGYFPSKSHEKSENASHQVSHQSSQKLAAVEEAGWIYDWRSAHVITPIQNQGGCGACVYFAAAATIEAYWSRTGHDLTVLSPQQLNDCAHGNGNNGCSQGGGTFVPTFDYIKKYGLTTEQNYPYLAKDAECNHGKEAQPHARINNWGPITPHGDEEALRKAAEGGPVAVAIHVSDGWARYKQGIFDEPCSGGRNHAVLVVGYGHDQESNKDYWICKNQWGEGFGENGYIRMRRNNGNMCDIAGDAVHVN